MQLSEIAPFLRCAELQPSVMSSAPHSCAYDYRLFYILTGEGTLVVEAERLPLRPGTLVYLRPGVPYYFEDKVKIIVLNFDLTHAHIDRKRPMPPRRADVFDPADITENDPPPELAATVLAANAFRLEPLFQECVTQYALPTPLSDAITSAAIKWILTETVRGAVGEQKHNQALVRDVMLYIRKNYNAPLSNTDVAAVFGYHSYYLNKLFKESTGQTLHQALLAERILIAKQLLKNTDLSIEAVSNEVGFSERAQFCTVFKKHTGKTPMQYRQAHRARV